MKVLRNTFLDTNKEIYPIRVRCDSCNSILEIEEADIISMGDKIKFERYQCPCCENLSNIIKVN